MKIQVLSAKVLDIGKNEFTERFRQTRASLEARHEWLMTQVQTNREELQGVSERARRMGL